MELPNSTNCCILLLEMINISVVIVFKNEFTKGVGYHLHINYGVLKTFFTSYWISGRTLWFPNGYL